MAADNLAGAPTQGLGQTVTFAFDPGRAVQQQNLDIGSGNGGVNQQGRAGQFNVGQAAAPAPDLMPETLDVLGRWEGSSLAVRSDPGGRDLGDELARGMADLQLDVSRLMRVSQSDYAAACHRFRSGLQAPAPRVLHRGESGFLGALRNAGEARGVWVAEKGPIAALDSHTLAAWASSRLPAEPAPPRKFFVY